MKRTFVAVTLACLMVFGGAQWRPCAAQDLPDGARVEKSDTLIAMAKFDLGLAFDEELLPVGSDSGRVSPSIDYTDAGTVVDRLTILTKELAASGRYSKAEMVDIKLALSETERDLDRVPEGAQRAGREAVERYFAVLDAM